MSNISLNTSRQKYLLDLVRRPSLVQQPLDQPYVLRKRFRHAEDLEHPNMIDRPHWSKKIIDFGKCTIFSRTPASWLKLVIYYVVFYMGIMLLWYICFRVFYDYLNFDIPRRVLTQPGFSFEPCADMSKTCLIDFHVGNGGEISTHVDRIYGLLSKYSNKPDHKDFGPCTSVSGYGFNVDKPCFFLKINRIIGYKVDPYTDVRQLPQSAPEHLKEQMIYMRKDNLTRVWISCQAEYPHIKLKLYPNPFVLSDYLEMKTKRSDSNLYDESDLKRIVALQVNDLPPNLWVCVRCYLWAKNIERIDDGFMGRGALWFKVQIRNKLKKEIKND